MAEQTQHVSRPTDPVGRILFQVSRVFALVGGVVLFVMAGLTTVSVTGRSLISAPVPGDFELVAVLTGVSVFAFLPYCHLMRGNVIVDFFMANAPHAAKATMDTIGNIAFTVIVGLLIWRMTLGGFDMYDVGQTTMILGVPRWWTFPLAVLCLLLLLVVCLYMLVRSIRETLAGREIE